VVVHLYFLYCTFGNCGPLWKLAVVVLPILGLCT